MLNEKITIKDIASEAGVSVSTVSRAINNTGRINPETKAKIDEIIKTMGYRPNTAAQSLRTQKTRNILLIIPDITNPFYSKLSKDLQAFVKTKNYNLMLFNTNEKVEEELRAIESAAENCVAGIAFASVKEHQSIINALKDVDVPTVLMNSYGACEFDVVHGAVNKGTYLSAKHLIENGHRRIGYVGALGDSTVGRSRKQGYLNALGEAGIGVDDKLIFEMNFSEDSGYKAGKYFVSLNNPPTAICCANDIIAMGVLDAFHEEKIKIPEQMSVTGMDDIIYSRISNPPLTSVTNDSVLFAENCFELLFERIEKRYTGEPREVIIDRMLVQRNSVAPVKMNNI